MSENTDYKHVLPSLPSVTKFTDSSFETLKRLTKSTKQDALNLKIKIECFRQGNFKLFPLWLQSLRQLRTNLGCFGVSSSHVVKYISTFD